MPPPIVYADLALLIFGPGIIFRAGSIVEHQLPVADRDAVTGIMIHFDGLLLIAEPIPYRIANLFLGFIVDRLTPWFGRRVGVFILHVLFNAIAAVAARGAATTSSYTIESKAVLTPCTARLPASLCDRSVCRRITSMS